MKKIFALLPILFLAIGCTTFTSVESLDFDTITVVNRTQGEKGVIVRNKETIEKMTSFFTSIDGWKHHMGDLPDDMRYMVFFMKDGKEVHRAWIYPNSCFKKGYLAEIDIEDFESTLDRHLWQPQSEYEVFVDGSFMRPVQLKEKEDEIVKPVAESYAFPRIPSSIFKGTEVSVKTQFIVNEDGSVSQIEILERSEEIFGAIAMKTLQDTIFQPGTVNGKPTKMRILQTLIFKKEDSNQSAHTTPASAPR